MNCGSFYFHPPSTLWSYHFFCFFWGIFSTPCDFWVHDNQTIAHGPPPCTSGLITGLSRRLHPQDKVISWRTGHMAQVRTYPDGRNWRGRVALLLWVGLCPPKRYVEVLNPATCECDLIWKYGLYRYNQIKMKSSSVRVGPNPIWLVSL